MMTGHGMTEKEAEYSIKELAEHADVSRRTIRYYIQRELLPAPAGLGRGKHYRQYHLDALLEIRDLQEEGLSLDAIKERLDQPEPDTAPSSPREEVSHFTKNVTPPRGAESWARMRVADGVELHVRADVAARHAQDLERAMALLQVFFVQAATDRGGEDGRQNHPGTARRDPA